MFLPNRYTNLYYRIIVAAQNRGHIKEAYDGYQRHHIIPRCMNGSDEPSNLVYLTYKEHRVCHRLLIRMTVGNMRWKMKHAYKLFNKKYDISGSPYFTPMNSEMAVKGAATRKSKGSYKTGKDNNFASPEIIALVKQRMRNNNPMKDPIQKTRMLENNPNCTKVTVENISFNSLTQAANHYKTTRHIIKKSLLHNISVNEAKERFQRKVIV